MGHLVLVTDPGAAPAVSAPTDPGAPVRFERRGDVEWITLNRPERLNAMTPEMVDLLADRFRALGRETSIRVVVLKGAGRGFCSGADIKAAAAGENSSAPGRGLHRLDELILSMRACPQPVIAAVHGAASGGGFALALAADVRIAGESTRMNDAFVLLGLSGCELGLSYFLPRYVGRSIAAELMLTGRFVDAERALRIGLVSEVVPDDELEGAVDRLAADMLRVSPLGLRMTKATLERASEVADLSRVMEIEMETQVACGEGPHVKEAVRAFLEKRPPRFESMASE